MDAVVRSGRRAHRRSLLQRLDIITERRAQARRTVQQAVSAADHGPGREAVAAPRRAELT